MTTSSPLQGLLGGVSLAIPVFALLANSGNVFGISGFVHRTTSPQTAAWRESAAGVLGLIGGGAFVGLLRRYIPGHGAVVAPLLLQGGTLIRAAASGLLVGFGSKLQNGCTSGHMICGISRFSIRSIVATAVFFTTGVVTTLLVHKPELPQIAPGSWALDSLAGAILVAEVAPTLVELALAVYGMSRAESGSTKPSSAARLTNAAITSFHFALGLQLSTLTLPQRVISFLALPIQSKVFDPTLFWLAIGALPLSILLYRVGVAIAVSNATLKQTEYNVNGNISGHSKGSSKSPSTPVPLLGGSWSIPTNTQITPRLILGATLFGIGWALEGICPGPALVNLGMLSAMRKSYGTDMIRIGTWLGAFAVGGLVVPS